MDATYEAGMVIKSNGDDSALDTDLSFSTFSFHPVTMVSIIWVSISFVIGWLLWSLLLR